MSPMFNPLSQLSSCAPTLPGRVALRSCDSCKKEVLYGNPPTPKNGLNSGFPRLVKHSVSDAILITALTKIFLYMLSIEITPHSSFNIEETHGHAQNHHEIAQSPEASDFEAKYLQLQADQEILSRTWDIRYILGSFF